jgi:putative restriction endonuclease
MAQSREERVARMVQGLEEGGAARVTAGYDAAQQPMPITIGGTLYRVFSWRISPGGRGRSPEEYRVQTTRPNDLPFLVAGEKTLLLGWEDELDVFAAWDVRMHANPRSSDSLQVRLPILEAASEEGFVTWTRQVRAGTELVMAFRPEAMATYLTAAELLPGPDDPPSEMEAAGKAGNGATASGGELPEDPIRRRRVQVIEKAVRDQRFRTRVLDAYEGCCAFCGLKGAFVEAAHVKGVGEGGPDVVVNGICACPTHHAAFDRGLLTVDDRYMIEVGEGRYRAQGCGDADIKRFREGLLPRLTMPTLDVDKPDRDRLAAHRERWR